MHITPRLGGDIGRFKPQERAQEVGTPRTCQPSTQNEACRTDYDGEQSFTHPQWIPQRCAVEHLPSRCNSDSDEAEKREEDGDDDELNVLRTLVYSVALEEPLAPSIVHGVVYTYGKVRNVDC